MAKTWQGITYDHQIREMGLALLNTEEGASYGTPALRVKGRLFAQLREEGDVEQAPLRTSSAL